MEDPVPVALRGHSPPKAPCARSVGADSPAGAGSSPRSSDSPGSRILRSRSAKGGVTDESRGGRARLNAPTRKGFVTSANASRDAWPSIPRYASPFCTGAGHAAWRGARGDIDVAVLVDDDVRNRPRRDQGNHLGPGGCIGAGKCRASGSISWLLNHAPALLRHRVISDGQVLFARSEAERVRFVLRTIRAVPGFRVAATGAHPSPDLGASRRDGHMVDVEIFSRRLDALDVYLDRLRRLGEASEAEYLAEPGIHDLAARYLHLAVRGGDRPRQSLDSGSGAADPRTRTGDSFTVLEEAGEIPIALAERNARLGGLSQRSRARVHWHRSPHCPCRNSPRPGRSRRVPDMGSEEDQPRNLTAGARDDTVPPDARSGKFSTTSLAALFTRWTDAANHCLRREGSPSSTSLHRLEIKEGRRVQSSCWSTVKIRSQRTMDLGSIWRDETGGTGRWARWTKTPT